MIRQPQLPPEKPTHQKQVFSFYYFIQVSKCYFIWTACLRVGPDSLLPAQQPLQQCTLFKVLHLRDCLLRETLFYKISFLVSPPLGYSNTPLSLYSWAPAAPFLWGSPFPSYVHCCISPYPFFPRPPSVTIYWMYHLIPKTPFFHPMTQQSQPQVCVVPPSSHPLSRTAYPALKALLSQGCPCSPNAPRPFRLGFWGVWWLFGGFFASMKTFPLSPQAFCLKFEPGLPRDTVLTTLC